MAASANLSDLSTRRLFSFLKPYRFWVVVKIFSAASNAANDIFLVYVMNILVNSSLSGDKEELMRSIYLMIVSVFIGIIVNFLETYSSGRFSACMTRDIKDTLSAHIDKLPISSLEAHHSGDLSSRMTNGTTAIENFFNGDFGYILFNAIRVSTTIIVMLFMNWQLLLLCMVILPLMSILTNSLSRPLSDYSSNLQKSLAKMNSSVQDTVNGIHIVKSYNLVQVFFNKFKALLDQMLADSLLIEKRKSIMGSVSVLVQTAPFLIFFLTGGYLVIKGHFTAGGLVSFAMLLNYLVNGMGALPNQISDYKVMVGTARHLFEILDEETERKGGKMPAISPLAPAISFNQVSFSYDGHKRVLNDVGFTLQQGKTIALVGASGSGKSTVFKLISGFYKAQDGDINLFGEPLSDWDLPYARSMISLVSQETFLFPGSLADNITCGKSDYSMEEVERAAQLANIHEYIQTLPNGYNSLVGERGVKLSGGQRQRISIARAILKDAPILLLDEATSALDTESEMLVQEAITRVMKEKTVLVVAHRLSTIIDADEVLVLDNGCMVERGTHDELLAKDGTYKRLYHKQLINQENAVSLLEGKGA
ncbi:ABC-type multidrug transport system fused ATPase/permease subunit [Paenibacillus cellulosilyticus]|uniref:ABC-type multidrug transport system fused ATPase/permease subunit n=2 Tax=Paenibacillus cellulosilyticus TaxID=375489 RepID=A0A2V2YYI3_9BACL|nr:ABC-type multidrug transport system fused ATPase/permease subunit [Paenibacillus cellulosilyticus]